VGATLGCLLKDSHDLQATGPQAIAELVAHAAEPG
jgi:hypothetical protein